MTLTAKPANGRDTYDAVSGDGDGKADALVKIGGDAAKFEPLIHASKWRGAASMHLLCPRLIGSEKPTFDSGKGQVELALGDEKHVYYQLPDGGIEYEIHLGVQPASNVFVFDLDFPAGVDFFYQPPLDVDYYKDFDADTRVASRTPTEAFDGAGKRARFRPEHIVGSYAVFWSQRDNQFKTGKFCHLHRPRLKDALGDTAWADLLVDPLTKKLTITCPAAWLLAATYPVVLDPTLGYTSIGASTDDTENYKLSNAFVAGANMDAATFYGGVSCDSGSQTAKGAGHNDSSGNPVTRLSNSVTITATTSMGFRSSAITWAGIVSGTTYHLAIAHQAGGNTAFDSSTGTCQYRGPITYADEMTEPFGSLGGSFAGRISCYVESAASAFMPLQNRNQGQAVPRSAYY